MEAEFPESVETCIDQWRSRPPQSVIYACVVSAYISLAFLPLVNVQPTLPLHFSFNHPSPLIPPISSPPLGVGAAFTSRTQSPLSVATSRCHGNRISWHVTSAAAAGWGGER